MRVKIVPSATDGSDQQFLTSFILNGVLALDAGCIGLYGTPGEQAKIANVVLTHSHSDHVCSLPAFAMNLLDFCGRATVVWAHDPVLESLREDVFNGRTWPDFLTLMPLGEPIVQLRSIQPRVPFELDGLRLTAIPVNHPVPTMGYIVEDDTSAIIICTDSGPTDELWQRARSLEKLSTMFVGVSFPNECELLAEVSGHLTPKLLQTQIATLSPSVRLVVVHIKAAQRGEVIAELNALRRPGLSIGTSRVEYDCSTAADAPTSAEFGADASPNQPSAGH
jgi:ribonuclease BN (tRNA processing enzyme)